MAHPKRRKGMSKGSRSTPKSRTRPRRDSSESARKGEMGGEERM